MEEVKEIPVTVYYSEKDDKRSIECVRFEGTLYVNISAEEESCELATREPEHSTEAFKSFIFNITDKELEAKDRLTFLAQKAQEQIKKLSAAEEEKKASAAPPAPPASATKGIGAGSAPLHSSATKNTYSIYALIDKCRPEINAKVNPKGYSLPDGKYELVMKDGHKIAIEADGNMAADLAQLSSKNEKEFAEFICNDLKAIVEMYVAMHAKLGDAAFPENKINLFVIKKDITSEEEKIKIAQIEKLVANEMHAYLSKPEYAAIKDRFTVLGQKVTEPALAKKAENAAGLTLPKSSNAPQASAPPLSEEEASKSGPSDGSKDPEGPDSLKMGKSSPTSPRI